MERRPTWAERKFNFVYPTWMTADFAERLRGVVPRVQSLAEGLSDEAAHEKHDGTWSIAQNIGHLADLEALWFERLDDLRHGRPTHTPADPARFQRAAELHVGCSLSSIIAELHERRTKLVNALLEAADSLHAATAYHERLQCPMRLVDCAQFAAEHDDHHLLRIRELCHL